MSFSAELELMRRGNCWLQNQQTRKKPQKFVCVPTKVTKPKQKTGNQSSFWLIWYEFWSSGLLGDSLLTQKNPLSLYSQIQCWFWLLRGGHTIWLINWWIGAVLIVLGQFGHGSHRPDHHTVAKSACLHLHQAPPLVFGSKKKSCLAASRYEAFSINPLHSTLGGINSCSALRKHFSMFVFAVRQCPFYRFMIIPALLKKSVLGPRLLHSVSMNTPEDGCCSIIFLLHTPQTWEIFARHENPRYFQLFLCFHQSGFLFFCIVWEPVFWKVEDWFIFPARSKKRNFPSAYSFAVGTIGLMVIATSRAHRFSGCRHLSDQYRSKA